MILLLGLAAPGTALPADDAERPRIGLVLSGGGARGAAHAGVLKVLEAHLKETAGRVSGHFKALIGT